MRNEGVVSFKGGGVAMCSAHVYISPCIYQCVYIYVQFRLQACDAYTIQFIPRSIMVKTVQLSVCLCVCVHVLRDEWR